MTSALRFVEFITPRESEVLDLVCDGLSDKAIANQLDISLATVRRHIESLKAKAGLSQTHFLKGKEYNHLNQRVALVVRALSERANGSATPDTRVGGGGFF